MYQQFCLFIVSIICIVRKCQSWTAVPANEASYALRQIDAEEEDIGPMVDLEETLPKVYHHSTYKFGWCTKDAIQPQYLHHSTNMSFNTWQSAQASYIYLLQKSHSQRFFKQCIVMKFYVSKRAVMRKSRIPMYYCQGYAFILQENILLRHELHEFYLQRMLNMPVDIYFEFYHPSIVTL